MAYRINMIYSDGEDLQDEVYDTYEEADEAAQYLCSCYHQGSEILKMGGEDYSDDDVDYEIIEE